MITLFYAGSLALLSIVLASLTGRRRIKSEINLGLGDDFGLLQISRAHGNLLENAPFFLILSFALEMIA
ncbi:MAG: MAPEG family protein, partial [SAR86 cluster bacterium]|nr:MAPEG family protein [SAR86 cluster bacterium]